MALGTDGAGTVAARGARVRRFNEGDAVYAYDYDRRGFYAEYVAVAANHAGHVPATLDLGHAGAAAASASPRLQGIDDALHVRTRDNVVILGASGAVGHLALQFAKLRGARVLAIASGGEGVALVRGLGADEAIDGKKEDIAAAARRFAPQGIDAVLALIGGASLGHCLAAVRAGGRLAYPNGVEPLPKKRAGIDFVGYDGVAGVREFARLNARVEAAQLEVHIGAEFPLAEAGRAHERVAAGHVLGKIVLRV
jgi:NADPH:quinone reductase-like Zn-dependent oxidoreductase